MPTRSRRAAVAVAVLLSHAACTGTGAGASSGSPAATPAPEVADARVPVDSFLVRFTTSKGDIDVMVRSHWAPHGAARVRETVDTGYYDGARFFRALRGFVVQFGIAADSAMTAAWRTRSIPDDSVRESNRRGTLVFAAGGPDTRTTQLFFNLRDNARLDAMGFPPVGEIVTGLDVLDALHTEYARIPGGPAPDQREITRQGEAYLARDFPLLDRIVTARVVRTWPTRR